MAEMRFTCPQCKQDIACDELWGGHQIQCPTCQAEISVPQQAAAPPPAAATSGNSLVPRPPAGGPKLSAGRTQVARSEGALAAPVRQLVAPPPKKKSVLVKILTTTVILAALGVGGYYGWGWLRDYQDKANAKRREAEKNSSGGQVGHIADLKEVLDATEPGGKGLGSIGSGGKGTGPQQRTADVPRAIPLPAGAPGAAATPAASAEPELPLKPAIWTDDLTRAKIPEGRVNGMISGTNFIAETIRVDATPASQVFRLTQGSLASPDREMLVYLHLKAGETFSGRSWNVSTDMKASDVPQVTKRWKTNPRYAPVLKSFPAGYVMKLEFGELTNGVVPGKVYIALPDTEQSVVAGIFKASATLTTAAAATGTAPTAAPAATPGAAAGKAALDRRYGPKP